MFSVWGYYEESIFVEVEESLCLEVLDCKFLEEGVRLGVIRRVFNRGGCGVLCCEGLFRVLSLFDCDEVN